MAAIACLRSPASAAREVRILLGEMLRGVRARIVHEGLHALAHQRRLDAEQTRDEWVQEEVQATSRSAFFERSPAQPTWRRSPRK